MRDLLIRGLAASEIAQLDAHAGELGISRNEYIRRRLQADARTLASRVTAGELERFATAHSDLLDEAVMGDAWR